MFQPSVPVIFCEATGQWAAAARSCMPAEVPLVQTRSIGELIERLANNPMAIAAIEWQSERAAWLLDETVQLCRHFPRALVVVLASRAQAGWESVAREAGAAHCIVSTRRLPELTQIALQHRRICEQQSLASDDPADLEERILASLPWGS